ncbi:MAG: helix-turn-helix domain-containing protein [Chroococcidiopsidaceae cyanobacterium CP_BM_RX_35]|nr:helix-turn-helix domain-containing protein [Chroococcidiopsidaceae cyanobacterium CP_BM_RX_35]
MTRKAHLEPYLSSAELKQCYQHCREPVESRRWHLLWLVSQNWQIKAAAAAVGLNYDYAKDIVQAYNQQGIESIENRPRQAGRRGRTPLLSPTQISELQQALRQPPPDGGIWSGPKVAQWIS